MRFYFYISKDSMTAGDPEGMDLPDLFNAVEEGGKIVQELLDDPDTSSFHGGVLNIVASGSAVSLNLPILHRREIVAWAARQRCAERKERRGDCSSDENLSIIFERALLILEDDLREIEKEESCSRQAKSQRFWGKADRPRPTTLIAHNGRNSRAPANATKLVNSNRYLFGD